MHNINDARAFYFRKPAWHNLGETSDDMITATMAGERIGIPEVVERPLEVVTPAGNVPLDTHKAVYGLDREKHTGEYTGNENLYCVVRQDYNIITHAEWCDIFDNATKSHVETAFLLGKGETFVLTAKIQKFDLAGDEMTKYLFMLNPINGKWAVQAREVYTRVVRQNTVEMALGEETEHEIRVTHNRQRIKDTVQNWLTDLWHDIHSTNELVKDAMQKLVSIRLVPDQVAEVTETVYPTARLEDMLISKDLDAKIKVKIERERDNAQEHQNNVMTLFESSPTRPLKAEGTAWGLVNAVAEYEQHMRDDVGDSRRARSALFGEAKQRQTKATLKLLSFA